MWYVKAKPGVTPIDPDRRNLLPAGMWRNVPENAYWLRMARDGDIELMMSGAPAAAEIEGYEPPAAMAAPAPSEAALIAEAEQDAAAAEAAASAAATAAKGKK